MYEAVAAQHVQRARTARERGEAVQGAGVRQPVVGVQAGDPLRLWQVALHVVEHGVPRRSRRATKAADDAGPEFIQ